jgi:hypothetical protein
MLAVEKASGVRLAATVREVSARASREIATGRDPHETLVGGAHLLEGLLARDLLLIRAAARREASRSFVLETRAAGLAPLTLRLRDDGPLDRSRAASAAKAFSGLWLTRGIALLGRDGVSPVGAPSDALEASRGRLETTARTEPAQAFGNERDGLTDDYAEESRRRGLLVPLKFWDATLDRKTCLACWRLNGTARPFGIDFPGGAVPGYVHPGCRCQEGVLPLPIPGSREDAPEEIDEEDKAA